MKSPHRAVAAWLLCGAFAVVAAQTPGHAILSGFDATRDVRNDDGTYTAPSGCTAADDGGVCPGTKIDLGFTVNFFGLSFSQVYINTNGNLTFDSPLPSYTPFNLTSTNRQIIAPFFADVDTRGATSGTTTFGKGTFGGRAAFGVTWLNAGYYYQRSDKRNSFQVILVDRSDTGAGNFDIVFNYDQIQWETGEAPSSGGVNGLGGRSARAGYSNGTGATGTALELRGSSVPGAFLDSNSATGLIHGSLNSDVLGRYIFFARSGQIIAGGLGITGPCPIPAGFQGIVYPSFSVSVSGGTPPYTITSVLPPGMTFDTPTLTVRGTPTASGDFPISVKVTDSAPGVLQQTREYACTMSIAAAPPPLKVSGTCAPGLQNRPYWTQLSITGGSGNYSISYNGPSWLAPAPSAPVPGVYTYSLAGTPPSFGSFPVSVTAKDSTGGSSAFNCAVSIAPSLTITSACPPSPVRVDTPFTYQFTALGGNGQAAWSIIRGQLPSGLTLTSTGKIFGTPANPGSASVFTISAYSDNISDQKTCSLTVGPARLQLTTACPGTGSAGVPYGPYPLTAVGGLGPSSYRFSTSGNFPQGLSIADNAIVGRPQTPGTYIFNIQVASGDETASSACTVVIGPSPITLTGACPAPLQQVGVPVSALFAVTGGLPPYSYTTSGPGWMSLIAGGVAGVPPPTAEGSSAAFVYTVIDSTGVMNSRTCRFDVGPPPVNPTLFGTCPNSSQVLGAALSIPLTAAGGQPPYTWTYNGDVAGLSLDSAAGTRNTLSGTLDKEGDFAVRVNLTDSSGVSAVPFVCPVAVAARAAAPPLRLSADPLPSDLLDPVPVTATLAGPAAEEITGTMRVTFQSAARVPAENLEATLNSGYEVPFKIPAGSTSVSLANVDRGTVAGSIHVQVTSLAGTGDSTPEVLPSIDIPVPPIPPVFSASVAEMPGGIEIVLKGYSTTREISGGQVTIRPRAGTALDAAVIDLSSLDISRLFTDHYAKTASGAFEHIRLTIPFAGSMAAIDSVVIELANSAGTAAIAGVRE